MHSQSTWYSVYYIDIFIIESEWTEFNCTIPEEFLLNSLNRIEMQTQVNGEDFDLLRGSFRVNDLIDSRRLEGVCGATSASVYACSVSITNPPHPICCLVFGPNESILYNSCSQGTYSVTKCHFIPLV